MIDIVNWFFWRHIPSTAPNPGGHASIEIDPTVSRAWEPCGARGQSNQVMIFLDTDHEWILARNRRELVTVLLGLIDLQP